MLESLRASAQGWIGRTIMGVLMGLIILSFAIWGIGDIFRGFGANNLAQVGGTEIGADTFRNAYQSELQRQQRLERRNITNEEAHQYGLDRQVLSRLVGEAALDDQSRKLGLAVSDDLVRKAIVNDDNFKGMTGQFDHQMLDAFLRDEGLTEKIYMRQQRGIQIRREIIDSLTGGLQLPTARCWKPSTAIKRKPAPSTISSFPMRLPAPCRPLREEALKKYFRENQTLYGIPEYRGLVVLPVTPCRRSPSRTRCRTTTRKNAMRKSRMSGSGRLKSAPSNRSFMRARRKRRRHAQNSDAGKTFDDLLKEKNLTAEGREPRHGDQAARSSIRTLPMPPFPSRKKAKSARR